MSWLQDPYGILQGYCSAKTSSISGYVPYIPSQTFIDMNGFSYNQTLLNVDRLPQTDVIDVITGQYDHRYKINAMMTTARINQIDYITNSMQGNIVALSHPKGQPFGTGLLIHSRMVLTARHCIDQHSVKDLVIKLNYQKSAEGIMDYGEAVKIDCILEQSGSHDYVIILLETPASSFHPFNCSLARNVSGQTLFFHHPDGGPKKVSVHSSLECIHSMINYSSFHDSKKGSSGGIYVNANGEVFALHLLNMHSTTSATFFVDIFNTSAICRQIFQGKPNIRYNRLGYTLQPILLRYRSHLETIETQPDSYPAVNRNSRPYQYLTYHHIIPKENLEFLWMLSKEYSKLDKYLRQLAWQDMKASFEKGMLKVNAVIWSPSALFVGPSNRTDDPKNKIEPHKPRSFNPKIWEDLHDISYAIDKCWDVRNKISKLTRKITIEHLDKRNDSASLGEPPDITSLKVKYFTKYQATLIELETKLKQLIQTLKTEKLEVFRYETINPLDERYGAKNAPVSYSKLLYKSKLSDNWHYIFHYTIDDDWCHTETRIERGIAIRYFKIRRSTHTDQPAKDVM